MTIKEARDEIELCPCDNEEALIVCYDALTKQIVNPPIHTNCGIVWGAKRLKYYACPVCEGEIQTGDNYCKRCGQRVR